MSLSADAVQPVVSLSSILHPIDADMKELDRVIKTSLSSDVALINQISQYLIEAGGKRIRPALLFLISNALSNQKTVAHRHEIAAVLEFIHTATLLHDDVVDESDLRRGRKTANAVFGNAASVLVGDFLYSRAFQMMVVHGELKIMEILANATNVIAEGEVLQLLNLNDPLVTEDRYYKVILYKTAKLFEASAELGAVLAKANVSQTSAAAEFGQHIGVVFQLVDDWLDYAAQSAVLGKNAGDDLREGKPTLPLIYLLNEGTTSQKEMAARAIEQIEDCDDDFFNDVLQAVKASGALEYTISQAHVKAEQAKACLTHFPDNANTQALYQICDYSLLRSF
ncbi:octaprenyl diphosphate synthase [Polynucleobacter sp. SHI8]|uniref:polyprenyl synthetase family protein n=1 Tax=unclassified Polynucleobacter TaxID=2640945 RepID=UPI0024928ABF|nr:MULTISPECIES: polyprenyl synthetase family protein [unclassified Polynucleobacter]BDW10125.1 octaprenyl diphosphate synthase [Polynucleobacter sp. SHI2]BDW12571.1 octaprenyl diphosphate synthase [Polynucleobacter sp. SHI8]